MGKLGFRDNGNPYVYEQLDSGESSAIGMDSTSPGQLKVVVSVNPNVDPTDPAFQVTIDGNPNGDITFTPLGSGATVVGNGNLQVLAGNIELPNTNAAASEGVVTIDGDFYLHSGNATTNANAFFGGAGDPGVIDPGATANTGGGSGALVNITVGSENTAYGVQALGAVDAGFNNIGIGSLCARFLTGGSNNILIGRGAASNYVTVESDNIIICNDGVVMDTNTIRIGTQGAGPLEQNRAFIAGIYGVTVVTGINMVTIDSSGQLGSAPISGGGGITTLDGNSGSATGATVNVIADTGEGTSLITGDNIDTLTLTYTDADFNTILGTSAFVSTHTPAVAVANTGLGSSALNAITTGNGNTAIGFNAAASLLTGLSNTIVGTNSLGAATAGDTNTALGASVLSTLDTGSDNVAIGSGSGSSYTGVESSNILISNAGVVGESNTIRIGTQGLGAGQQSTTYIAGVYNTGIGTPYMPVFVDSNGSFGSFTGNDGEILIGSTGDSPAWVPITPGTNISIVNAPNSITINATGAAGFVWSVITADQTAVVNNGYICNKAGTLALALPATAAIGDLLRVTGINTAAGWQITQAANQQIFFGTSSTTLGATGTLTSTAIRDSVEMVCVVAGASTVWNVLSSVGSPNIA